jgi:hypothetical protein
MAIRKSQEENFSVQGTSIEWVEKVERALKKGRFTNIKVNNTINQITGDYKKFTVWGEIIVTVLHEGEGIKINVKSTANVDNIFALISSPNQKILNQFKNNL